MIVRVSAVGSFSEKPTSLFGQEEDTPGRLVGGNFDVSFCFDVDDQQKLTDFLLKNSQVANDMKKDCLKGRIMVESGYFNDSGQFVRDSLVELIEV